MNIAFLFVFLSLLLLPFSSAHFFEEHALETILAGQRVNGAKAEQLNSQYLDVLVACNFATDYSVLFYYQEDGKKYRFTHSRQFYNNMLRLAGSDPKKQACAVGAGLHIHQDVNSHGQNGEDGYTGETLKRWFVSNTLGHPVVERNMIAQTFELDSFNYKGQTYPITQADKDLADFYKRNALNIFQADEELMQLVISASGEISEDTVRNALSVVGTAVSGEGKQNSVWGDNINIPSVFWITGLALFFVGLVLSILYIIVFIKGEGWLLRIFAAQWIIIFLLMTLVGGVGIIGLLNGQAFTYYENTVDFAAKFLKPTDAQTWMEKGVANSVQFLETGIHNFADGSGWNELGEANRNNFFVLLLSGIYWIITSVIILRRL
jgi:hypothetical protein